MFHSFSVSLSLDVMFRDSFMVLDIESGSMEAGRNSIQNSYLVDRSHEVPSENLKPPP